MQVVEEEGGWVGEGGRGCGEESDTSRRASRRQKDWGGGREVDEEEEKGREVDEEEEKGREVEEEEEKGRDVDEEEEKGLCTHMHPGHTPRARARTHTHTHTHSV